EMVEGVKHVDAPTPEQLKKTAINIATIATGVVASISTIVDIDSCDNVPPRDLKKGMKLDLNTDIEVDNDKEDITDPAELQKCNIKKMTAIEGNKQVEKLEIAIEKLSENVLKKTIVGEDLTVESPNGMVLSMRATKGAENTNETVLGKEGA
ncbi:unnamed protein product, partial [Meganyctiphanes norvegica]